MKTNKAKVFDGAPTECKFENGMTLELWYSGKQHKYVDAKKLMSDVVKCWNMHDEMLEVLKELIRNIEYPQRSLSDRDGCMIATPEINKAKELIKKASE